MNCMIENIENDDISFFFHFSIAEWIAEKPKT